MSSETFFFLRPLFLQVRSNLITSDIKSSKKCLSARKFNNLLHPTLRNKKTLYNEWIRVKLSIFDVHGYLFSQEY